MTNPLDWMTRLPDRSLAWVFHQKKDSPRDDVAGMVGRHHHWSTDDADIAVGVHETAVFAYLPATHELVLVPYMDRGGAHVSARTPCPDTWEEAKAWLKMAAALYNATT